LKEFSLKNPFQNFLFAKPSAMPIPALPEFMGTESESGIGEANGFADRKVLKEILKGKLL
jgi:hypothetical protein